MVESFTESAYLGFVLVASLGLFALSLVAAVYVWQSGRTQRQRMGIEWEREKLKATQHAEAKRWEEALKAVDGKLEPLEKRLADYSTRLARIEENREVIRLSKVGT